MSLVDVGHYDLWDDEEHAIEEALFEEGFYAHVTITPFTQEEVDEAKRGTGAWTAQEYPSCPTPWLAKGRT